MSLESALRSVDPQDPDYHATRAAIFDCFGDSAAAEEERHASRTMARLDRYRQLDGRFLADDDVTPFVGRWDGGGWLAIDPDDVRSFADTAGLYFAPEYCHTGGYDSMGSVGEANIRSLEAIGDELDEDPDAREIDEWTVTIRHYAYGGKQALIAIRADTDEFLEAITGLSDYPLIDDECHSEVEMEMQDRDWANYDRDETLCAIEAALEIEWSGEDFDVWLDDIEAWDVLAWENHGSEMHLCGVDRLIEGLNRDTLIESGFWKPED